MAATPSVSLESRLGFDQSVFAISEKLGSNDLKSMML
jgi:hypothetical protein